MAKFAFVAGAALVALCVAPSAQVAAQSSAPPDFSSNQTSWIGGIGVDFTPVEGSPSPLRQDPAHPFVPNGTGKQPTYRIADLSNPNLKQWAKDIMKKDNDEVLAGKIAFTPMQVRHVYMDVPHSANPKPSWYGESVGHYEGDTLVIDTIGQNTKTVLDAYRTPHSAKLHTVERWRTIEDGKTLEVVTTIDDPETYNAPWQGLRKYRRGQAQLGEQICAEGNFLLFDYGIPVANKPDF